MAQLSLLSLLDAIGESAYTAPIRVLRPSRAPIAPDVLAQLRALGVVVVGPALPELPMEWRLRLPNGALTTATAAGCRWLVTEQREEVMALKRGTR